MALFPGSTRQLGEATPIDVVLVGPTGLPLALGTPAVVLPPQDVVLSQAGVTSAASVTLSAADPLLRGRVFHNNSARTVFVALGPVASAVVFSFPLAAGATYEIPSGGYAGDVSGITATGLALVLVTEIR